MSCSNTRVDQICPAAFNRFPLLRRLSIASLVAMLVTAAILIFAYRQDQLDEHEVISVQVNEKAAIHLMHALDNQINLLVKRQNELKTESLWTEHNIDLFTEELEKVRGFDIIKLKIYNLAGKNIYSSVKDETGSASKSPDLLARALSGEVASDTKFYSTFISAKKIMHHVYIVSTYTPLIYEGKRIGVMENYTDVTPIFTRINSNIVRIALIVFSAFSLLYAALFIYVRRTDCSVAEWQKIIAKHEEAISKMAFYDALTQLPNRFLLNDRLEKTMAASKRSGLYGAVVFLDMDNFKPLNDTYGHDAGDLLLVEGARRISSCVREMDTVARFGGDEFVVVISELDADKAESATQAYIVAEKIRTALAEPYVLKVQRTGCPETTIEYQCTSSIGMVLFTNHEASMEDLLKWADIAMYQAKESGRNLIRLYDSKA